MTGDTGTRRYVSVAPEVRRWLVVNALLITAGINVVLNAGIAWVSVLGHRRVPLLAVPLVGGPSTITDSLGTLFVLPLITCLLVSVGVRRDIKGGQLPVPERHAWPGLRRLPRHPLRRGLVLGSVCLAVLGGPVAAGLAALQAGELAPGDFVVLKTLFAVGLGVLVTPVIALAALVHTHRE